MHDALRIYCDPPLGREAAFCGSIKLAWGVCADPAARRAICIADSTRFGSSRERLVHAARVVRRASWTVCVWVGLRLVRTHASPVALVGCSICSGMVPAQRTLSERIFYVRVCVCVCVCKQRYKNRYTDTLPFCTCVCVCVCVSVLTHSITVFHWTHG